MRLGNYLLTVIPDAPFRLDGGAMFGVVPRVLWEKSCPPDERNRILLQANCLLLETPSQRILLETGMGDKWTPRQTEMYGLSRERSLSESICAATGHAPEDITLVINTHLHFDHAGGNTRLDENGDIAPTFPNARYLVSRSEYEVAENPSERDRASYLPENWRPLVANGQLELRPDNYEAAPGLTLETVRGHSATMQCWRLDAGGQTVYGFADLIPTRAHIPLPWIMGYDLFPVETLEAKKRLLPQAARENWLCYLYHEPKGAFWRVGEENGKLKASLYL
jgi:glyoxylase-like metal-dependent hydrolase (beta-lactamase superfamily II)